MGAVGKTYGFVPPEGARKYLKEISRGIPEDDIMAKRCAEAEDTRLGSQEVDRKKRKSESDFSSNDVNHLMNPQESDPSKET